MTPATAGPPPEAVIVGAGTFGSVLAARLTDGRDRLDAVVLDAGGWDGDRHVQSPPLTPLTVPPPAVPGQAGRRQGAGPGGWHVPWDSPLPYQGLAHGVGGRSRFWGAYCLWPQLTKAGGAPDWPPDVVADLTDRYLPAAAGLLGLTTVPRHLDGRLNTWLGNRLREGLTQKALSSLVPLDALPDHPGAARHGAAHGAPDLRLHLPMAVRIEHTDDGGVSLVRFSAAALLRDATRRGSRGPDVRTHHRVLRLHARDGHVHAVETPHGTTAVGPHTPVVLAAGTVENARLVLDATRDSGLQRSGTPFTTHLRSNLTLRLPLPPDLLEAADPSPLGAACLALRGTAQPEGVRFHHQITSFTVGAIGPEEFRDLFSSTPRRDVESLERGHRWPPTHLIVTIAGVAETASPTPGRITLGEADAESGGGAPRALVEIALDPADHRVWRAMDASTDELVALLGQGGPVEVLRGDRFEPARSDDPATLPSEAERHEPLGCGHHEMGSLAMNRPVGLATDSDGLVRGFDNLYVAGPAVFPGLDSAGPVLPGIALTLRLADTLKTSARSRNTADH